MIIANFIHSFIQTSGVGGAGDRAKTGKFGGVAGGTITVIDASLNQHRPLHHFTYNSCSTFSIASNPLTTLRVT